MKTSNLPKSMKFWFPDLGIADFESSGPQLFKNQLFKIFKIFKIQNKKNQKKITNHQPTTINHHTHIYKDLNPTLMHTLLIILTDPCQ